MALLKLNNSLIKLGNDLIGKTIPFEGIILDVTSTRPVAPNTGGVSGCIIYDSEDNILWDSTNYTSFYGIANYSGLTFDYGYTSLKILPYDDNFILQLRYTVLDIKQWGSFSFSEIILEQNTDLTISASDAPTFAIDANIMYLFRNCTYFNSDISHWDVQNVKTASATFDRASSFNQDLSSWYFPLIPSKPGAFDRNTTSWVLPKPNFGIPAP